MKTHAQRPAFIFCLTLVMSLLLGNGVAAQQPTKLVCDIWPPYQTQTATDISGLSVEIVQAVYKRMGIPANSIQAFPWRRAIEMLRHGDADALFSANYTQERQIFAYYPSEELFQSPWVIWTRRGDEIFSLDDLKGKTIGVVSGYSYTPEFWDFINANCIVESVNADMANFKKLNVGRVDATVAEYGNGLYLATNLRYNNIVPNQAVTIKRDGLYIIFSRKKVAEDFVKDFSSALIEFKKTNAHTKLWGKYFQPSP